jgi:hypothetical protein
MYTYLAACLFPITCSTLCTIAPVDSDLNQPSPAYLSYPALPYHNLSYPALRYPALPNPTPSYPVLHYTSLSCPTLPYPTLPYPTLPHLTPSRPLLTPIYPRSAPGPKKQSIFIFEGSDSAPSGNSVSAPISLDLKQTISIRVEGAAQIGDIQC